MRVKTGTHVLVRDHANLPHEGQVMFQHHGTPNRVMVAWLQDPPEGYHEFADWVTEDDVESVRPCPVRKRR